MGGLEPCADGGGECHGSLCTMRASEYEKVWLSEGGGAPRPGYEEVVVVPCRDVTRHVRIGWLNR